MLERTDQPLAEDLPLMREVRAALHQCLENGLDAQWRDRRIRTMPSLRDSRGYCRRCIRAATAWASATCSPKG